MFKETKQSVINEITKYARQNIIKKLKKQGVDYKQLHDSDFNDLVADEIEILKTDTKKVGAGIAIGIALSLVTGI